MITYNDYLHLVTLHGKEWVRRHFPRTVRTMEKSEHINTDNDDEDKNIFR